ncbi:hypothetical protein CF319_g842 [Tilletia indica]|nr:hypothetical protein CF319_g842 [Tilletia indica]
MIQTTPLTDTVELPPPTNPTTWSHIKDVICRGNLDDLYRDPACELAYRTWSKPVKAEWGSLERFIRVVRLEWDDVSPSGTGKQVDEKVAKEGSSAGSGNAFFEDMEDEWHVKMIPNHWPYNIPLGCRHWCVWSRKPITHISQLPSATSQHTPSANGQTASASAPAQANGHVIPGSPESLPSSSSSLSSFSQPSSSSTSTSTSTSTPDSNSKLALAPHARAVPWPFPDMSREEQEELYAAVSHDGIRALVLPEEDVAAGPGVCAPVTGEYVLEFFRQRLHHATKLRRRTAPEEEEEEEDTEEELAARAADATMAYFSQHCYSFVLKTFPPEQGWRSVLFCNPPHLRTVPGLDHWHIMSLAPDAPSVE